MNQNKIVTINGQRYDAHTGLPITPHKATLLAKKASTSSSIHTSTQKSQTLIRRATKKPAAHTAPRPLKAAGRTMDIARSSKITRFAPRSTETPNKPEARKSSPDIPAAPHPIVSRAMASLAPVSAPVQKIAQDIKNEAIAVAMAKPTAKHRKKNFFRKHPRGISIVGISIIIALIGGYITYINMPNLSVSIASAQAGIEAKYPDYHPDGYSLDGPVTFGDGQVTIKFKANTGNDSFTLKQAKSSWDSSAVLDNIVRKAAGEQYLTSQEHGITIYSYNGNAAWVNGGILYTINGTAPLSSDQIRRIAMSM